MKRILLSDGGRRFEITIDQSQEVAQNVEVDKKVPVREFIAWWREQARQRGIPYQYGIAEPMGHRIISRLLRRYDPEQLREMGVHFFLDHSDLLREKPAHFSIFSSMSQQLEHELKQRGGE